MKETNLRNSQDKSLRETLLLIESTLKAWITAGREFKNLSHLAETLSETLGFHRTLFLQKPNPKKSPNQGKHRAIVEKYAHQLGVRRTKTSYEDLERQLVDAKRDIQMLEDAYKATLRFKRHTPRVEAVPNPTSGYFYEFEQTCLMLSTIINHSQGGLQFISGNLYDTATITGIDELVCEGNTCKPYLEWQSNKNTIIGKIERLEDHK
ncbi:TPA: hypothetical protein U8203_000526 [Pseudomonas putida]|nr:hypothetical protein [Pseudomonas putida]HEN8715252.1 hypothetical protein [Pseudomonas putida]